MRLVSLFGMQAAATKQLQMKACWTSSFESMAVVWIKDEMRQVSRLQGFGQHSNDRTVPIAFAGMTGKG